MSRTKRIYNKKNRIFYLWDREWVPMWHPYKTVHCHKFLSRKHKKHENKKRRAFYKRELNTEVRNNEN